MPNYAADLNDPANTAAYEALRATCEQCERIFLMSDVEADRIEASGGAVICPRCDADNRAAVMNGDDDAPLDI